MLFLYFTEILNIFVLYNHQFAKLLEEVYSQYSGVLINYSVRWLSHGHVLLRFVELLEEIGLFLSNKSQDYPEINLNLI